MYLGFVEHINKIMNVVLGVILPKKKKKDFTFKNL